MPPVCEFIRDHRIHGDGFIIRVGFTAAFRGFQTARRRVEEQDIFM